MAAGRITDSENERQNRKSARAGVMPRAQGTGLQIGRPVFAPKGWAACVSQPMRVAQATALPA